MSFFLTFSIKVEKLFLLFCRLTWWTLRADVWSLSLSKIYDSILMLISKLSKQSKRRSYSNWEVNFGIPKYSTRCRMSLGKSILEGARDFAIRVLRDVSSCHFVLLLPLNVTGCLSPSFETTTNIINHPN